MEEKKEETQIPSDLVVNPDGTAIFTINEQGKVQGNYTGTFTFRCFINPLDNLAAGKVFRELLGPFGADANEDDKFMAFALSQLQKRIIKSPPWWQTDSVIHGNIPDSFVISI